MKISLPGIRKGKASKKAVTGFDQAKWIRGFSIAAICIWVFYSFVIDFLPYEIILNHHFLTLDSVCIFLRKII